MSHAGIFPNLQVRYTGNRWTRGHFEVQEPSNMQGSKMMYGNSSLTINYATCVKLQNVTYHEDSMKIFLAFSLTAIPNEQNLQARSYTYLTSIVNLNIDFCSRYVVISRSKTFNEQGRVFSDHVLLYLTLGNSIKQQQLCFYLTAVMQ